MIGNSDDFPLVRRGPSAATHLGVFLVAMATLMYQVLLTRIFSVSMWYHFGFIAISLTMFGMTVGALIVYQKPRWFSSDDIDRRLTESAVVFAVTIVLSFLAHLSIPFITKPSLVFVVGIALTYVILAVPFVASGVCLTLALTRMPESLGSLYAADLVGAGVGCLAVVGLLEVVDGPSAVLLAGGVAAMGGLAFSLRAKRRWLRRGLVVAAVLLSWGGVNARLVAKSSPLALRLVWVKGRIEDRPLWERWNSFSRVAVWPWTDRAFGWGLSDKWPEERRVDQLLLNIDASAATVFTRYTGKPSEIEHLGYDVSNVAHHLRPDSRVLTVGVGGGHDILSAVLFKQPHITGVELNGNILYAVNGVFGDYTGHLDRLPQVKLVNDEARSYIARTSETFDIIQVTLIDTWAATSAGAFVLSENALYTVEAWSHMLDRLSPRGVLTFSRYYFKTQPAEVYRLTTLAAASLRRAGVTDPRSHIMIVRKMRALDNPEEPNGVGTILVSPSPFSDDDITRVETLCDRYGFQVVLTPRQALDTTFAALASASEAESLAAQARSALNIAPPTDDAPFFFHMLRLRDFFRRNLWNVSLLDFNLKAVAVLVVLLVTVLALTTLCIVVPLYLTTDRRRLAGARPLFVYFAGIGFGFMLVEISMMQRLNIFLGHPIYGMTVVLFCLLVSSGLGSAASQRLVRDPHRDPRAAWLLGALLLATGVTLVTSPFVFRVFEPYSTPIRILVAALVLCPPGLTMGTAFPIGMRLATARADALAPWLWAINGATSVCASVIAIVISLSFGISAAFASGIACYVVACFAFIVARRQA